MTTRKEALTRITRDDTEHGKEYYLASDVDALLAQPEQEPVANNMTAKRAVYFMERFKHEEKLLGPNEQAALDFVIALLEAQSEPMVDMIPPATQRDRWMYEQGRLAERDARTHAQPEQEPVYQIKVYGSQTAWHDAGSSAYDLTSPNERRILYTTPPQRTWVGLTDEEINEIWASQNKTGEQITRDIEAKLKEKNT